jgi:hypothetical protein
VTEKHLKKIAKSEKFAKSVKSATIAEKFDQILQKVDGFFCFFVLFSIQNKIEKICFAAACFLLNSSNMEDLTRSHTFCCSISITDIEYPSPLPIDAFRRKRISSTVVQS